MIPAPGVLKVEGDPFGVKLERGQRGTYGWEITVRSNDMVVMLSQLDLIDQTLREHYGPQEAPAPVSLTLEGTPR